MDQTEKKIDLIDQFIANEKKAKTWTIISVGLFIAMGILILVFGQKLNKKEKQLQDKVDELNIKNRDLDNLKKELIAANERCDEENKKEKGVNNTLQELAVRYDSTRKVNDTLALLLNTFEKINTPDNPATPGQKLEKLYTTTFPEQQTASKTIEQTVKQTNLQQIRTPKKALLFIHCMPGYENKAAKVKALLERNQLKSEGIEIIRDFTFNPAVKYFRQDDQPAATKILDLLNNADLLAGDKFFMQPVKLKAPPAQIEIWIGDYQKPDFDKLIQQKVKLKANAFR